MTHKEKEMINTNRAVLVKFPAYTSGSQLSNTSSANIYIPFPVKQINIKGIDLDFDADAKTMYFTSNLVDNNPMGSGFGGILMDASSTTKQLTYLFKDARDVNGTYTFHYFLLDIGASHFLNGFVAGTGVDSAVGGAVSLGMPEGRVLFMIEFIGYA